MWSNVEATRRVGDHCAKDVAPGGELHDREKYRDNNSGANRRRNVTPEQKQQIAKLYAAGKKGLQIAKEIGISKSAVYKYLELDKTGTPTWNDDELQIMVDGYLEKEPPKEIAKKVGRSPGAVAVRMCRHRKEVRNNPKKRRALSAITMALRAVRKADIFRELSE